MALEDGPAFRTSEDPKMTLPCTHLSAEYKRRAVAGLGSSAKNHWKPRSREFPGRMKSKMW
jgi:hypothetical protein